ncbi:MAG: hypothetical protein R3B07_11180 [Polyangiaceae bacterium]
MHQRWPLIIGSVISALVSVGCDAAKGDYEDCLELEKQGKLEEASKACEAAVQKDPGGASGRAAQEKLAQLQVKIVSGLSDELKKNNLCTEAQLKLIDAKPEDKPRLTADRDAKCKGVIPSSSAK